MKLMGMILFYHPLEWNPHWGEGFSNLTWWTKRRENFNI
jgi:hypothetical protein